MFSGRKGGRKPTAWLGYGLVGLGSIAVLIFAMYQFKQIRHGVEEMAEIPGYFSFHRYEQLKSPDSQSSAINYAWTRPVSTKADAPPVSQLRLFKVPREFPEILIIEMSLARPSGATPARVELNLLDDESRFISTLAVYTFDPNQPGFNRYSLTLPPTFQGDEGANLEIRSNSFTVPGDGRELGVRVRGYELEMQAGRWGRYIWPQPFILACLILFLSILIWGWRVQLSGFELGFTLWPLAFVAGTMSYFLRPYSWLCLACAIVVGASSWLWQRDYLPIIGQLKRPIEFMAILFALSATILFFLFSQSYPDDVNYHHLWAKEVHSNGPFNIYNNSPSLNYLPLAPYFFWLYSWIAYPLGLEGNTPFLKAVVSLALILMVYIVWRFARRKGQNFDPQKRGAVLVMFSFNIALLYNPVIWGQVDVGPTVLLVLAFCLLYAGYLFPGVLAGCAALIFKPQALFALPLIGLIILKLEGFRRTFLFGIAGLGLAFGAAAAAFGFDWNSFVNQFWLQGQLAGQNLDFSGVRAYNFPFILNYTVNQQPEVVWVGLGIIAAVYLLLAGLTWFKAAHERDTSLAIAIAIMVCFIFAIKMHERYPFYALPFLGIATLYDRRASKPWLLLSLISVIQLIISRIPTRRFLQVPDTFYLWNELVQANWSWLTYALSWATIGVFSYMLGFYLWRFFIPSKALPKTEDRPAELVEAN